MVSIQLLSVYVDIFLANAQVYLIDLGSQGHVSSPWYVMVVKVVPWDELDGLDWNVGWMGSL